MQLRCQHRELVVWSMRKKMTRGSILSNMVFDKIGKGGGGEKARLARLACTILVAYVEPKKIFFRSSSGNFSSAAPNEAQLRIISGAVLGSRRYNFLLKSMHLHYPHHLRVLHIPCACCRGKWKWKECWIMVSNYVRQTSHGTKGTGVLQAIIHSLKIRWKLRPTSSYEWWILLDTTKLITTRPSEWRQLSRRSVIQGWK
jgi:hypothetical protein